MSVINQLNLRLAAKKMESLTPLERVGTAIYEQALGTTTGMFSSLIAKQECCPLCGEDLSKYAPLQKAEATCPSCGKKASGAMSTKVDTPAAKPVSTSKPVTKKPDTTKPNAKGQDSLDQAASANKPYQQRGGFLHEGDTPPRDTPSASDMVQNMGAALGHRVEVNSDASGMGVSHAAMMVHPEWNQDNIKSKIKSYLEGKGWTTENASKDKKSVTHTSPDGHKVHVHHVGHHLVVSSEDAEGTIPKALRQAPQADGKDKKDIKKEEHVEKGGTGSGRYKKGSHASQFATLANAHRSKAEEHKDLAATDTTNSSAHLAAAAAHERAASVADRSAESVDYDASNLSSATSAYNQAKTYAEGRTKAVDFKPTMAAEDRANLQAAHDALPDGHAGKKLIATMLANKEEGLVQKDWAAWNAKHKVGDTVSFHMGNPANPKGGKIINRTDTHAIIQPTNSAMSEKVPLENIVSNYRLGVAKEDLVQKDWAAYDAKHGKHSPAQFNAKNPKIDLHHKETGAYLGSTNWSPNVAHAVANYEEKNPHLNGLVKGFRAKKSEDLNAALTAVFKAGLSDFLSASN